MLHEPDLNDICSAETAGTQNTVSHLLIRALPKDDQLRLRLLLERWRRR